MLYYDAEADAAWEYRYPAPGAPWVAGNTLAYRKSLWQQHQFPDIQVGEDSRFVWGDAKRPFADLVNPKLCIGVVHQGNTSRKDIQGMFWHALRKGQLLSPGNGSLTPAEQFYALAA